MANVSFKTLKKTAHLIVKQPSKYVTKDKNDKVKATTQIQYIEGYPTIDVFEQRKINPEATPDPIYINKGILTVNEDNINLLDFLRKHEDNEANGGRWFREVDVENDEIYEIDGYKNLDKARTSVINGEDSDIRAMAMWFLKEKNIKDPINKIKIILRQKVETDPKFVDAINKFVAEKTSDEKLIITIAIQNDILKINDGRKVVWADSDEAIFISPQATDVLRNMSVWLKADEDGREYAKLISQKIKELKKK